MTIKLNSLIIYKRQFGLKRILKPVSVFKILMQPMLILVAIVYFSRLCDDQSEASFWQEGRLRSNLTGVIYQAVLSVTSTLEKLEIKSLSINSILLQKINWNEVINTVQYTLPTTHSGFLALKMFNESVKLVIFWGHENHHLWKWIWIRGQSVV